MRKADGDEYMISPFAPVNLPLLEKTQIDTKFGKSRAPQDLERGIRRRYAYVGVAEARASLNKILCLQSLKHLE